MENCLETASIHVRTTNSRERMRMHLSLILHACTCRKANGITSFSCLTPLCEAMRQVVTHAEHCCSTECTEPHCRATRALFSHFFHCKSTACDICSGLKHNSSQYFDNHFINGMEFPKSGEMNGSCSINGDSESLQLTEQQREKEIANFLASISVIKNSTSKAQQDPAFAHILEHVKKLERETYIRSDSLEFYQNMMRVKAESLNSDLKQSRLNNHNQIKSSPSSDLLPKNTVDKVDPLVSENPALRNKPTSVQTDISNMSSSNITCKPECDTDSPQTSESSFKGTNTDIIKSEPVACKNIDDSSPVHHSPTKLPKIISPVRDSVHRKVWCATDFEPFNSLIESLQGEKDAFQFLEPVDWKAQMLHDYPKIISHPMDISTIAKKIKNQDYSEPWEIVDDFWLMFNNAWLYNKKASKTYKSCTRLAEIFETFADPLMHSLGFCCAREYFYQPPTLTCLTSKFCAINRDANYYSYECASQPDSAKEQTNYIVCERCFNDADDEIKLDTESATSLTLQKSSMVKCRNDVKEKESFIYCKTCGRKWHQVCALHLDDVWTDGFNCRNCLTSHNIKRKNNPFTAKSLPSTKLSSFIEKRVNDFLKKKDSTASEVIIRVLAAADKVADVKSGMKNRYCTNGEMSASFPYRVKAIFAFQEHDGQEVCFFGLHVQEYGSECPSPNTRRVYIAYLDSVHFFSPKHLRTEIYHELLISYLHYVKFLGFNFAHIWACPPSEGDDYIFHMHPYDQKIPKPKRLQEWYQRMLDRAMRDHIVTDFHDICRDKITSPTEFAYFEGDFWPNTLEEIFKEMDLDDARRREEEALAREEDMEEHNDDNHTNGDSNNKPEKKKPKKRKLKRNSTTSLNAKRRRYANGLGDPATELMRRLTESMEKHKENFFVIRLQSSNNTQLQSTPIRDTDPLIQSDLMECRGTFLERSREKHLEFSTLRRAKFATLVMLYDLHTETRQPMVYTCNNCSIQLETPYHCNQCVEYDLCVKCYKAVGHAHPMTKVGLSLDGTRAQVDVVQESGRDRMTEVIKSLEHCCCCRDANCRLCVAIRPKLKHFHDHRKQSNCNICGIVFRLCLYHSRFCNSTNCPVPHCAQFKANLKRQQKQQRVKQTQMLRRRMAFMQRCHSQSSLPQQQPSSTESPSPAGPAASPLLLTDRPSPDDRNRPSPCRPSNSSTPWNQPPATSNDSPLRHNTSLQYSCHVAPPIRPGRHDPSTLADEVQIVHQAFNSFRQRGSLNEFPAWLNANPGLTRAWQCLQQQYKSPASSPQSGWPPPSRPPHQIDPASTVFHQTAARLPFSSTSRSAPPPPPPQYSTVMLSQLLGPNQPSQPPPPPHCSSDTAMQ